MSQGKIHQTPYRYEQQDFWSIGLLITISDVFVPRKEDDSIILIVFVTP